MNAELIRKKLAILADAAKYDASCSSSGGRRARQKGGMGNSEGTGICHSYTPDGRCISLLKILLTNFCIYDCRFCINRVSSDTERAKFSPEEVVWLTLEFYRRNYIEGLFLSSGIINSIDVTMEQMILVAKTLREKHKFNGYIHLKVVPGASQELIERAGLWADRVSANIELPTQEDLNTVAPAKTIESATDSMSQIKTKIDETKEDKKKFKKTPRFAPAGQTTQMIVGATPSTDAIILDRSSTLYSDYRLRRVYYSAYSPIPNADGVLPIQQPSLVRENRLYQADWLMRFYGFQAQEIVTADDPHLALDIDPKLAWALRNRHAFPVDVNKAPREMLLRIPGIGVRNVQRILQLRPFRQIRLEDLKKLRISLSKTKYFVTTIDHNPDALLIDRLNLKSKVQVQATEQLSFFESLPTKLTGEI